MTIVFCLHNFKLHFLFLAMSFRLPEIRFRFLKKKLYLFENVFLGVVWRGLKMRFVRETERERFMKIKEEKGGVYVEE